MVIEPEVVSGDSSRPLFWGRKRDIWYFVVALRSCSCLALSRSQSDVV